MFRKGFKVAIVVIAVILIVPWIILIAAAPFNSRTPSETDLSKSALRAKPPAPLTKEVTLKVVTYNVHDMWLISLHRAERMRGIAAVLKELDPDIVGFQEAWVEADRQIILEALAGTRLKYHQYYPSGTVGSGKFVVSAYPIVEAFFHRYTQGGKWYKPYHGDWWGGKGVALARIELPDGAGCVDFYDTHAHAGYGSNEYDGVRESQMQEHADFVKASATGTSPAILVGDFNCRAGSKAFEVLKEQTDLIWLMDGSPRIDNIFVVRNPRYAFDFVSMATIDRKIPIDGADTRLSDHNGYMSTIRIRPAGAA